MNMRKYIQSFIAGITAFTCLSVYADGPQITGIPQNTVLTTTNIEAMCSDITLEYTGSLGKFYTAGKYPNIITCSVDGKPSAVFFVLRKNMTYLQWVQAKIGNVKGFNPNKLDDVFINLFDNTCLNNKFSDKPVGKSNSFGFVVERWKAAVAVVDLHGFRRYELCVLRVVARCRILSFFF